ncbi:MAG TPA: hypothetical protein DEB06_01035, partial [Phycisphaerales bacterium]|nr:hypothetical protein [Phycisphaerales bacterium]
MNDATPNSAACSRRPIHTAALVLALLIAGLLGFTAYAKGFHPNPKPVTLEWTGQVIPGATFDRSIAVFEVVVLVLALALHRKAWAWGLNAVFFAALGGFGAFKSWHGEACGCFAQLFDPPAYSMAAVDGVIVLVSLGMASALGLRGRALPVFAGLALGAGIFGWVFADGVTPPRRAETAQKYEGKTAVDRLIESAAFDDIRTQPDGGPAWLVFCFDPTCHICEAMKPLVEFQRDSLAETGDPVMQIRQLSIPELEKAHGIETHAWETPTLFIYAGGKVTRLWTGNQLEEFQPERLQEIYDRTASGEFLAPAQPGEDGAPNASAGGPTGGPGGGP